MSRRTEHWVRTAIVALLLVSAIATSTIAAEERKLELGKWYPNAEAGVTLTESAFSDNWSGGDKGSVVWTLILNAGLENQVNAQVNWKNTLKLAYGQALQQKADATGKREWDQPLKSTDLINFETIFRFTLQKLVDPFVSANFESQFQDASDPSGRNLSLNPMKFKETGGIARQFINEKERTLQSRIGFAFQQSRRKLFTDPVPSTTTISKGTNDGGVEWVTELLTKLLDNRVSWSSKLVAYKPVFYSEKGKFDQLTPQQLAAASLDSDLKNYPMTADVNWENILTSQITKIISVNLYVRWVYDKYDNSVAPLIGATGDLTNADAVRTAVRKAGQFKQTLALGLTYHFF